MLTEDQISLVSVFTQALLYGIYLATLTHCFRWLIFTDEGWKPRQKINSVMTLTTIFIFLTSTINLATLLTCKLKGCITRDTSWFQYGTVMMANISENLAIVSIDGVLIYRCWVVYANSWHVIFVPVIFWLASLACSVLGSYYSGLTYEGLTNNPEIAMKALTSLYACNIAITIYTTTAIIYRILSIRRNSGSNHANHKQLNYVMRILAESGILYTSMIIFSLVGALLATGNNVTWVESLIANISDTIGFSTGGISFNLLLIRVYQSRVESRDNFPDSRDDYGLSGINNPDCSIRGAIVN